MGNCLKIQLKAEVNNPNLPILEKMQQFTLDAITASGNSSMTEAQQWALNHFFYQIGAINNSTLWQKMKAVILPIICNDNLNKVAVNYIDNTIARITTGTFDSTHGYIGNTTVGKYTGSSNGLGLVFVSSKTALVGSLFSPVGILDSAAGGYVNINKNVDLTYSINWQQSTIRLSTNLEGFSAISELDKVTTHYYVDGNITSKVNNRDRADITITNKDMGIEGIDTTPCGVAIIAYGLTSDEAKKLLQASKELKDAFAI